MTVETDLARAVAALDRIEVPVPPYTRLRRRQRARLTVAGLALLLVVGTTGLAAAGSGRGPTEDVASGPRPPGSTTSTTGTVDPAATEAELVAFCTVAASTEGERPEGYVGSPQHIDDVGALLAVAPDIIRAPLATYLVFLSEGGVDPADPDSSLTESWPPDVRAAVEQVADYVDARCADGDPAPSQTPDEATRDGVVPALAAWPLALRSQSVGEIAVEEDGSRWIVSRPAPEAYDMTPTCSLGVPDGVYGTERICIGEYDEILLLDPDGGIVSAYPLPGHVVSWYHATADAVYAGRIGDGALPDSSIVRIDRRSRAVEVVVFEIPGEGVDPLPALPGWRLATADEASRLADLVTYGADRRGTPVASPGEVDGEPAPSSISVDLAGIDQLLAR